MRILPLLLSATLFVACGEPPPKQGDEPLEEPEDTATDTDTDPNNADADDDGYPAEVDCDDTDAAINPGAAEVCDPADVDEDCNGLADGADPGVSDGLTVYVDADGDGYGDDDVIVCELSEGYAEVAGDCDDADPARNPATAWHPDADGDGYGAAGSATTGCEQPDGTVADASDCDDADATRNPETPWYADADGDGFGDAGSLASACEQPDGYVADATDCDDGDAARNPDTAWHPDADGDGFGDAGTTTRACEAPSGHVSVGADCDDTDAGVSPGATEVCDAADADEDCDGRADDADPSTSVPSMSSVYVDADGDGYGAGAASLACEVLAGWSTLSTDCDDADAAIAPGATETWYDGIDADCAGDDDDDQDADGVSVDDDCDDVDAAVGAPEAETLDGRDNDCDGTLDELVATDAAAGVLHGAASAGLGAAQTLSLGGDLTGDGVDDLVLGAPGTGNGYAWVVSGASAASAAGAVSSYDTTQISGQSSYYPVGWVTGPSRDLTGDGTADVLVAAAAAATSSRNYGYAYLISGTTSGSISTSSRTASFTGDSSSTDGLRAATAGDLDGDGVNDVVTGAPYDDDLSGWTSSTEDCGNVAVFQGGSLARNYDLSDADDEIHGAADDDWLGYSLAVGDYDADGYADVLASAPGEDSGGTSAGAAYLLLGSATLTWSDTADLAAEAIFTGTAGGALGTYGLPEPGDLDGDGLLDLVLASTSAYVFFDGSHLTGTMSLTAADSTVTGTSGDTTTVATAASDLDGDGADDLVLGSGGDDVAGTDAGAAYVFSLVGVSGTVTATAARATLYGDAAGDGFGQGLAGGGDADGDGLEDLLVGAPGADAGGSGSGSVYVVTGW